MHHMALHHRRLANLFLFKYAGSVGQELHDMHNSIAVEYEIEERRTIKDFEDYLKTNCDDQTPENKSTHGLSRSFPKGTCKRCRRE